MFRLIRLFSDLFDHMLDSYCFFLLVIPVFTVWSRLPPVCPKIQLSSFSRGFGEPILWLSISVLAEVRGSKLRLLPELHRFVKANNAS